MVSITLEHNNHDFNFKCFIEIEYEGSSYKLDISNYKHGCTTKKWFIQNYYDNLVNFSNAIQDDKEISIDLSNYTLRYNDTVIRVLTFMEINYENDIETYVINQSSFVFSIFNETTIGIANNLLAVLSTIKNYTPV